MTEEKSIRIKRAPHGKQAPYYLQARSTAQDNSISYEALGVLVYLLSKPDDWKLQPRDLERDSAKKHKIYRIINELIAAGYIVRTAERNERGVITQWHYDVYEQPLPNFQDLDDPDMDNQDITNKRGLRSTEKTAPAAAGKGKAKKSKPAPKPAPKPTPEPDEPRDKPDDWFDFAGYKAAIKTVFGISGGRANELLNMLRGTVSKDRKHTEYWRYMPEEPVKQHTDLLAFGQWYMSEYPDQGPPAKPETVNDYITRWQEDVKEGNVQQTVPDRVTEPSSHDSDHQPLTEEQRAERLKMLRSK